MLGSVFGRLGHGSRRQTTDESLSLVTRVEMTGDFSWWVSNEGSIHVHAFLKFFWEGCADFDIDKIKNKKRPL